MNKTYWGREIRRVESAYGFERGYQLLYCPWKTINRHEMTFLSLNPGGRTPHEANPNRRLISDERGNSYEVERDTSRSPIASQFLRLCEFKGLRPSEVLAGALAPFRSDRWSSLTSPRREASLDVGRRFWTAVLRQSAPDKPIVVCSKPAADIVKSMLGARCERKLPAGWGSVSIRRYRAADNRLIVHLPHLSRYKLFGRAESKPYLIAAFGNERTRQGTPCGT